MRHFMMLIVSLAMLAAELAQADRQEFSLSTGYNETALKNGFNRGTAGTVEFNRHRQMYVGTINSHGLASMSIGYVISATDIERVSQRYPMLTIFCSPDDPPGLALTFHEGWYVRPIPSTRPPK